MRPLRHAEPVGDLVEVGDALVRQPLREVGVVAGALPADAHVLALRLASGYGAPQQSLHGRIALIEVDRQQLQAGISVQPQRELGKIVGADGEAVEVLEEVVGEQRVRRQLAHHDDAQAVDAVAKRIVVGDRAIGIDVDDRAAMVEPVLRALGAGPASARGAQGPGVARKPCVWNHGFPERRREMAHVLGARREP